MTIHAIASAAEREFFEDGRELADKLTMHERRRASYEAQAALDLLEAEAAGARLSRSVDRFSPALATALGTDVADPKLVQYVEVEGVLSEIRTDGDAFAGS